MSWDSRGENKTVEEGTKVEEGREWHKRGRRAGQEQRKDKWIKVNWRENGKQDVTGPQESDKSADDTSSLWARSEPNTVLQMELFLSSTNVHSLPNSLSNKQLNTHINTADSSQRISSNAARR